MSLQLVAFEHRILPLEDEVRMQFRDLEPGQMMIRMSWVHPDIRSALLAHLTGTGDAPVHFRVTGFALVNNHAAHGRWFDDVEITMDRISPSSAEKLEPKTLRQVSWINDIVAALLGADQ